MRNDNNNQHLLRLSNEESNRITKEALQTAIILLLKNKEYEKISITDIANKAGVSRSAFYRNYQSKDELVKDACKTIRSEIVKTVSEDIYRNDKMTWYRNFFTTIKENEDYFQIYLDTGLPIEDELVLNTVFPPEDATDHYRNVAKEGAFINILINWFNNKMEESPEEMAKICLEILNV